MGFRSDAQLARVCAALCRNVGLGHLWTSDGPTPQAVFLLQVDGGPLSSGERIVFLAAWAFWNNARNVTLADVALRLDAKNTAAIASLMLAAAHGSAAIDNWLAAAELPLAR